MGNLRFGGGAYGELKDRRFLAMDGSHNLNVRVAG